MHSYTRHESSSIVEGNSVFCSLLQFPSQAELSEFPRFGISPSKTDSFLGTTTLATIFLIAMSTFLNLLTKSTVAEVLGDRQWQPELCQSHY